MIEFERLGNGYYRVSTVWPAGLGVRFHLHLVDPDGDVDDRVFEWVAPNDMPLIVALIAIIAGVDALPHWRGWIGGNEISIGPTDSDYTGTVTGEVIT